MTIPERVTAKNVDLSNCDREQIQFAGAVLPHGVLLVLREPEFTIAQVSQNTFQAFGIAPDSLLGKNLNALLDARQVISIIETLQSDPLPGPPSRIATVPVNGVEWNVLAHRYDQVVFLEFEPASGRDDSDTLDLYSELRPAIARLQNARSSQEFLDLAVNQIRGFTGFDRVLAYKFLADNSGVVRAESVIPGLISYLGQHFPASDIPLPARRMFSLSWVRHQPDIGYVPVPVIPDLNPITGRALDMSLSVLRSVSAMYTGYLKNMGTQSTMVLTLMKAGQPWGLISCLHHSAPKFVPYEVRAACELLANMASLLISEKEELEFSGYKLYLHNTQNLLIESMSAREEFTKVLLDGKPNMLAFVQAGGAAVVTGDKISLLGNTPTTEQVRSLVEWLSSAERNEIFATNSLSSLFPRAESFRDSASGVLAVRFAATKKDYLLWFRPEVLQTVKWAGDPSKPVDFSSDGERLLPRTSFALWIETVKLKSEPWLDLEIRAAREFRIAILEIIMRQAERLRELYQSLERSHVELDAFAVAATAKFRAVFEQTYVFAGIMTIDGTLINANRVWLEMGGYRAEDVLGLSFWDTGWRSRSTDLRSTIKYATQQAAQGTPYRAVLKYYWADGTERLVEFAIHPIRDDHEKIIFLHAAGLDVTDLKRVEGELRKSHEDLEEKVADRTRELALILTAVESEVAVRKQTEEQLRELSSQVLRMQDEERRRIARDLHDSTGQTFAAVKMVLGQLSNLVDKVPDTLVLLEDLNALADQGSQEIRTISYLLHPPMLDEVGFSSAAEWYVDGLAKRSGITITIDLSKAPRLSNAAELALFRVLQESLTNVLRHSGSKAAEIRLYAEGGNAFLSIRDYGKGIARDKVESFNRTGAGSGVGLGGMKQRLRDFGGRLSVESDATGTVIVAMIPITEPAPPLLTP
jgi:two-component system, chemotaxis family, sensor kinase Cph1